MPIPKRSATREESPSPESPEALDRNAPNREEPKLDADSQCRLASASAGIGNEIFRHVNDRYNSSMSIAELAVVGQKKSFASLMCYGTSVPFAVLRPGPRM